MKVALDGRQDMPPRQPTRVNRIAATDEVEPDWVYAENDPPIPPEITHDLLDDGTVAMEAPSEAIPAFPRELFGLPPLRKTPQAPPRVQAPAPVEDLRPTPAPVLEAAPRPVIRSMPAR